MVTLSKIGASYNRAIAYLEGLSSETKPTVNFIEYDDNGTIIKETYLHNGSIFTEIDTGTTYMYDADNVAWYEVSIGGGGGGTSGGIVLVGETTTALTDNATTNPIMVNGQSYTAQPNDAVIYGSKEFLFDGTKWHEFGDLSGLSSNDIGAMTNYTIASTGAAIVASDTLNQAMGKVEKRVTDTETKTDRIIMDNTETQDYYMQDSTPSNPTSGDYWFSDDPLLSSDITAMIGYAKAQTASAIVATDSLNQAIGKLEKGLDGKQATIDANNKLSADNVDDSNTTHKFATAAQLTQIGTNETNILLLQDSVNGREFTFTSGGNIATNVDVGATVDITPNPVSSWSYTVSPCIAGEVITITGQGGSTPRLWAFTDKDYKLISKAADGAGMTGGTVTAPANTAYCIINSTTATLDFCGIEGLTSVIGDINTVLEGVL